MIALSLSVVRVWRYGRHESQQLHNWKSQPSEKV